jgi:hypothetical protein
VLRRGRCVGRFRRLSAGQAPKRSETCRPATFRRRTYRHGCGGDRSQLSGVSLLFFWRSARWRHAGARRLQWSTRRIIISYGASVCSHWMGGERRLFFSLQRARRKALQEGDLSPERVTKIAGLLGVTQGDVISMDCGLRGADYRLERGVWRRQ